MDIITKSAHRKCCNIGMTLGISKCKMLKVIKGKFAEIENIPLDNNQVVNPRFKQVPYKYLCVPSSNGT